MRTMWHKIRNPIVVALLSTSLTLSWHSPVWAETVLEQIRQTGILRAGTRTDALPFAYVNAEGEWVGFSIDLMERIRADLEQELSRPVQLELVEVTPRDRLSRIAQGELDLVCESASYTFNRSRFVDFSVVFFKTGTQFLVRRDLRLNSGEFRVGIIPSSTNASTAQGYLRVAEFVRIPDRATGLADLDAGRIDAIASDGILLEGIRQTMDNADAYALIPSTPIQPEFYSCILQQDNPEFMQIVDRSIVGFMTGFLNNQPQEVAIFERWFGDEGVVPFDRGSLESFFRDTVTSYQQRLNNQQPELGQDEPPD